MAEQTIKTVLEFADNFTRAYSTAMGKAQATTDKTIRKLRDTKISIGNLQTAVVGFAGAAGVGLVTKAFYDVGQETESLTLQFETLLKSTDAANERMQELSQFAATTPFQLDEIAKASKVLQTLGGTALATGDGLKLVGDAAAISGERIDDLAVHIGRAYSGLQANRPIGESASRLQELGLISGQVRNQIEKLQTQAQGEEAWKVLQNALSANDGAMLKLSETAGGLVSTIKDQMQAAIRTMLDSGIWDLFRDALRGVRDRMEELLKGNFFQNMGVHLLTMTEHANKAVLVLRTLWNVFQNGISVLTNFGQVLLDVVKLSVSGFKGIALAMTGDLQGAFEATNGKWEEFTESFKGNMADIVESVMTNQADINLAISEGAQAQIMIESAKYEAIKKMSDDTTTKVIQNKKKELSLITGFEKKSTELTQKEKDKRVAENLNGLQIITGSLSQAFENNKALAIADSVMNTYVAANKALAQGGIFGPAAAAAVVVAGLANVAKIKGQNFNRGGIVQGLGTRDANQPTFLTAGEGILTKDATNRIGAGGINAINDRNAQSRNITNNVTFAPTINAANDQSFGDMLRDNFTDFRDFFNDQIDKGEILV